MGLGQRKLNLSTIVFWHVCRLQIYLWILCYKNSWTIGMNVNYVWGSRSRMWCPPEVGLCPRKVEPRWTWARRAPRTSAWRPQYSLSGRGFCLLCSMLGLYHYIFYSAIFYRSLEGSSQSWAALIFFFYVSVCVTLGHNQVLDHIRYLYMFGMLVQMIQRYLLHFICDSVPLQSTLSMPINKCT